jgi:DNA-binding response OmpR family regulator
MSPGRILLVDDQRDTTRMLRTMLEFLDRGFVIVDVPSGEEAMLEVRRGPFDLVVTDVRLPGISGLELAERVRKANPGARLIVISGLPDPELREAARELEADAFFPKPLDSDLFMETVQAMLAGGGPAPPAPVEAPVVEAEPEAAEIAGRLLQLRRDLGALALFLVDADGRVVMSAGDVARLDVPGLVGHLMVAFSASQKICGLLGDTQSANVQFFDGKEYDVYTLSVGQTFLLVVTFEGERGARAMGPVMSYGRPAAGYLRQVLEYVGVEGPTAPALPARAPLAAPAAEAAPLPVAEPALEALLQQRPAGDAEAFWEAALAEAEAEQADAHALSYEQAQTLGLLPNDNAP